MLLLKLYKFRLQLVEQRNQLTNLLEVDVDLADLLFYLLDEVQSVIVLIHTHL